jgi:malonate-semialdehyde dehydrogenase (acetylating)/methylmalonate-semialdehyde dehydrogenase
MIAFWFLPYSLACGNTVIVKPSERVPLTMQKVFSLLDKLKLPEGGREPGERRTRSRRRHPRHPVIRSVSFVGSSTVARHVYSRGAAAGKRVQCQGGAKNPVIIMPDADMSSAAEIVA